MDDGFDLKTLIGCAGYAITNKVSAEIASYPGLYCRDQIENFKIGFFWYVTYSTPDTYDFNYIKK
jgi:hypothetical protein